MSDKEEGDIENPDGMPIYSKDFLDNRAQEEFNKYFGYYVADGSPSSLVDNLTLSAGYANSSYQYFTPKSIKIYGEDRINQPSYRNPEQNIIKYDLDRYGELFYDIISMNRQTKYLNHPFYELKVPGVASPRQLEQSILGELAFYNCISQEDKIVQLKPPVKSDKPLKSTKVRKQQNEEGNDNIGLFSFAFGGSKSNNGEYNTFLNDLNKPYSPNATGSFGVLSDTKRDKTTDGTIDQLSMENSAKPPIKFLFNILGELELRPDANLLSSYEKASFNSSLVGNKKMGITAQNVKNTIEGPLSFYPNQLKSLYTSAASQQQLLLGNGFDAVRVELEDQDAGTPNTTISAIIPGQDFPPYAGVSDPMKVYSKFLAFWMNYKQIAVLEYLAGFGNMATSNLENNFDNLDTDTESFNSKLGQPIWKKFDIETYELTRGQTHLCRWRNFSPSDIDQGSSIFLPQVDSKDLFDLPIYNNYFLLRG